jgi:hypothetical protein
MYNYDNIRKRYALKYLYYLNSSFNNIDSLDVIKASLSNTLLINNNIILNESINDSNDNIINSHNDLKYNVIPQINNEINK